MSHRQRRSAIHSSKRTQTSKDLLRSAIVETLETRRFFTIAGFVTADINPGSGAGFTGDPDQQVSVDNVLYFAGTDGNSSHGLQLWKSDGTAAGTTAVTNIKGMRASGPHNLTAGDGIVFFTGKDGNGVQQVWRSNGTSAWTFAVTKFTNASTQVSPYDLTFNKASNKLYFGENTATVGSGDLYITDATGPNAATRIGTGMDPQNLTTTATDDGGLDLGVYFYGTDSAHGQEMWFTAGTSSSTQRISDINPGPLNANFTSIQSFDDQAVFTTQSSLEGPHFWIAGKEAGQPPAVEEIPDGTSGFPSLSSNTIITNLVLGKISSLTPSGGHFLTFVADDGSGAGSQIWDFKLTAGGSAGIQAVTQLPTASQGGVIDNLTAVGTDIYFTYSGNGAPHLYRLDGIDHVTEVAGGAGPDGGAFPSDLTNVGGVIYFAAQDNNGTSRLFNSDGKSINLVASAGEDPNNIISAGTTAFYQSTDATAGRELHNVGTFNIGSNLTITQGSIVNFRGHYTGTSIKSYKWDLNGDGKYETGGSKPSMKYITPTATNSSILVRAKMYTTDGHVLTSSTHVTVRPAPPTVTFLDSIHKTVPFLPTPFSVKVINWQGDAAKNVTVRFDFGDGTIVPVKTDSHGVARATHVFTELTTNGLTGYMTASAADTNGATNFSEKAINVVQVVSDATEVAAIDPKFSGVFVGGTSGDDRIDLFINSAKPRGGKYEYLLIYVNDTGTSIKTNQSLRIYSGGGDDRIELDVEQKTRAYIDAGLGDDTVNGGLGNDTLLGGGGNDILDGRGGTNVIEN